MEDNKILYIDNDYKIKEGTIVICKYIDDKLVKTEDLLEKTQYNYTDDVFPMVETEIGFIDPYMFAWVYKNNVNDADNKITKTNELVEEVLLTLLSIALYHAYIDTKRLLKNKTALREYAYELIPPDFVIDLLMDEESMIENFNELKEEIVNNPDFIIVTEWPKDETIL